MSDTPAPGRAYPPGSIPPEMRQSLRRFHNLTTDEQVLDAIFQSGIVMVGRPPDFDRLSSKQLEDLKRFFGDLGDDEAREAETLMGLVTVGVSDVAAAARNARHPLLVAKIVQGSIRTLENQLRQVVPVLRERGCSWTQIGAALGITKQSAWERFSGED